MNRSGATHSRITLDAPPGIQSILKFAESDIILLISSVFRRGVYAAEYE